MRNTLLLAAWSLASSAFSATLIATPDTLADQLRRFKGGDVLLLKPGVYRTSIDLRNVSGSKDAPTTIRGEVAGQVILRGSDVLRSWKRVGPQLYARDLNKEPSQVFVNGDYYKQIGGTVFDGYPVNSRSEYYKYHQGDGGVWHGRVTPVAPEKLPVGSFIFDTDQRVVYVKSDKDLLNESANVVEASQRERVFFAENDRYLVVENLDIQHANTSVTNRGAALVVWRSSDVMMRNLRASWNDLAGLQFGGDNITLEDSESSYNGQTGVMGFGTSILVQRVRVSFNNRRSFNKYWEAGGFKFVGFEEGALRNAVVRDCVAVSNQGDGIWLDWKNADVQVTRNVSAYNSGFGIHYEASSKGQINENIVMGNGQRGIFLSTSRMSNVMNNLVIGNGGEGIVAIKEKGRVDGDGRAFKADGNRFEGNIVGWNAGGAVIVSADEGAYANRNVYYGDGISTRYSVEFPSVLNLPMYGLEAWSRSTAQDWHSWFSNKPMPDALKRYLAQRSLDAEVLRGFVKESRRRPGRDGIVYGPGVDPDEVTTMPTADVGPPGMDR